MHHKAPLEKPRAGRRPGQPAFSAAMAEKAIRKAPKTGPRRLILADRIAKGDRSRAVQAKRLDVCYVTLAEAEASNRWPIGAAGKLLRQALGAPASEAVQS